jgi:DNA-directed RNA polymerase subunit H
MNNSHTILRGVFASRTTLIAQASAVGFDTTDFGGVGFSEMHAMFLNDQLNMEFERAVEGSSAPQKVYIRYHLAKISRPPQFVNDMYEEMFLDDEYLKVSDVLVIVMDGEPNESMSTALKDMYDKHGIMMIVHNIARLQFNILDNDIVPTHTVLGTAEVAAMQKRYNVDHLDKIPTISRFDPPAQAMFMRPGQVCRIDRKSKTALVAQSYRMCINV